MNGKLHGAQVKHLEKPSYALLMAIDVKTFFSPPTWILLIKKYT